jgi:UDP-N-acetylglucosamine--N-acetylmuramyl-(pentapeptide) pyrophosphoryl-undecaprenol N-acetylglucosamine transferase
MDLNVAHQTGREAEAAVRDAYHGLGLAKRVTVMPFIDDVPAALTQADVVVGRAGASFLAELCAVGRASLLIPFPFAADDHQLRNAESLAREGAATVIPQGEATAARVARELGRLAMPDVRLAMARAAMTLGRPEAAMVIARDLLKLATSGKPLSTEETQERN